MASESVDITESHPCYLYRDQDLILVGQISTCSEALVRGLFFHLKPSTHTINLLEFTRNVLTSSIAISYYIESVDIATQVKITFYMYRIKYISNINFLSFNFYYC